MSYVVSLFNTTKCMHNEAKSITNILLHGQPFNVSASLATAIGPC